MLDRVRKALLPYFGRRMATTVAIEDDLVPIDGHEDRSGK